MEKKEDVKYGPFDPFGGIKDFAYELWIRLWWFAPLVGVLLYVALKYEKVV